MTKEPPTLPLFETPKVRRYVARYGDKRATILATTYIKAERVACEHFGIRHTALTSLTEIEK